MRRHALLVVAVVVSLAGVTSVSFGGQRTSELLTRARFACYPAQFKYFAPRQKEFGGHLTLRLVAPDSVCVPAPGSYTGYLTCYRPTTMSTAFSLKSIQGFDEFGKVATTVSGRALTVCLPAARVDQQPTLRSRGLDAYACYPVRSATQLNRADISVSDAFGSADESIKARTALCAPVAAQGARVLDPNHWLSCYTVDSDVVGKSIITRDEFGLLTAALGVRTQLCTAVRVKS